MITSLTGVQITNESITSFTNFKLQRNPKAGYLIMRISDDKTNIIIDQLGPEGATYEEFCKALTIPGSCRYGIFMVNYETNEGVRHKTGFFLWCPGKCKCFDKMLYAGSYGTIKRSFEGIQFEVQGGDFDDFDFEIVLEKCRRQFI